MNQIDKLKEFNKKFVGKSGQWLKSPDNVWSWIIQNFTPKEEVKEIMAKSNEWWNNKLKESKKEMLDKLLISEMEKMLESLKLPYPNPYGEYLQVKRHNEMIDREIKSLKEKK